MQFKYRTNLETGGGRAHVCLEVDDEVTDPRDRAFVLELLERMIQYDKERAATPPPPQRPGRATAGAGRDTMTALCRARSGTA